MDFEPWGFHFLVSRLLNVRDSLLQNLADSVVAAGPETLALFYGVASQVFLTWLVN